MAQYKKPTKEQIEAAKNKREDSYKKLLNGVRDVFQSGKLEEVLKIAAKFSQHNYSFQNCIMIAIQRPDATLVKGFHQWQKLGRRVKKGERGIAILAPRFSKFKAKTDDESDEEFIEKLTGFRNVYVFDVSQTDGKEIPQLIDPLNSVSDKTAWLLERLDQISPMPIQTGKIGQARGQTDYSRKAITISDEISGDDAVKTKIHEIVHAAFHEPSGLFSDGNEKHEKEVMAEAVSYIVCENYGIDSSKYSFVYVGGWLKAANSDEAVKELARLGQTYVKAAQYIIAAIDEAVKIPAAIEQTQKATA